MSHVGRFCRLVGVLLSLTASGVGAQASSRFASSVLSGWSAGVSATGGWEEGLQFIDNRPAQANFVGASGNAAKLWQTRRDRIEASASGSVTRYPTLPTLDRLNYDFNTGILHSFSRSTTVQLGVGTGSIATSQALTPSGTGGPALFQLVQARTNSGLAAFRTQFGRRISAEVSASGQDIRTETAGVLGGQFATATASLAGQLSRTLTLSLIASTQYSKIDTNEFNLPRGGAALSYRNRSGLIAVIAAGAVSTPGSVQVPLASRLSMVGNLAVPFRKFQFAANAQREVGQVFGLAAGLLVAQTVGGGVTTRMTRSLTLDGAYSIGTQDPVGTPEPTSRIESISTGANYVISRGAVVTFSAFARRFTALPQQIVSRGVTTGFAYRWSQQRRSQAPPR